MCAAQRRRIPTAPVKRTPVREPSAPWLCKVCGQSVQFVYPGAIIHTVATGERHSHVHDSHLYVKAADAKADAIQRADDHAPDYWKRAALETVSRLATDMPAFTADDIWASGLPLPPTPSAIGPVLRRAQANGVCVPTEKMVPTRFARRHHDVRVWRSLIYVHDDGLDFMPAL